ncbi:MAG: cupin domain-containing protein [Bacteroidales bacterium]
MVKMENNGIEKARAYKMIEVIEYVSHSVAIKSILKKPTGSITAVSFDTGEVVNEKIIPFDTFIQIIEGKAEFVVDGISHLLNTGQSIIVPAHSSKIIKANERFKMISIIIKSGYE